MLTTSSLPHSFLAGFGAGTPQQEALKRCFVASCGRKQQQEHESCRNHPFHGHFLRNNYGCLKRIRRFERRIQRIQNWFIFQEQRKAWFPFPPHSGQNLRLHSGTLRHAGQQLCADICRFFHGNCKRLPFPCIDQVVRQSLFWFCSLSGDLYSTLQTGSRITVLHFSGAVRRGSLR